MNIIVQEKQMLKMEIPDKGESSDGVKHSRMESRPVSLDISRNKSEFFNMSDAKVNKKQWLQMLKSADIWLLAPTVVRFPD